MNPTSISLPQGALQGQAALDFMKQNPRAGYNVLNSNGSVQSNIQGDKGWLGNILNGLATPFLNAGRFGGQMGQDILSGITNNRINAGQNQALTGEERTNMPEFLAKTAAGLGSYAVGGSIPGLALGGGLQSFSNQRVGTPIDVGDIAKGAIVGAGTGALMHGAGGILQGMQNNAIEKAAQTTGENILNKGAGEAANVGENATNNVTANTENAIKDFSAEHPSNAFRGENSQTQNALNDFYTRPGKGTLDLNGNKGLLAANMEGNINSNLSNLEDYRLNLKDAGTITDNKITPENIGKIQDAAGQDIASKVKNIDAQGAMKSQSALNYIADSTQGLKGIDNAEALKQAEDLVKEFRVSKTGPLTAEDYQAIKQGTDGFSKKFNQLDLTGQQAFGAKNKVALALNDSSRQLLVEADPTLQKSLQTYSFIDQNKADLKKAYVQNMQNNIVTPRLTKGGIVRSALNGVQDVYKQGLIDKATGAATDQGSGILGKLQNGVKNILPAVNVPQPLINTLQSPIAQKLTGVLANMSPQQQSQNITNSQAASGLLDQQKTDNATQQQQFALAERAIKDGASPQQLQALGINIPGLGTGAANTKAAELQVAKNNALKVVQQAEKMAQNLNLGSGILGKINGAISNTAQSPAVKAYNDFVAANASVLAKAFGTNSSSKTTIQKYIDALPSPTDTKEEAQAKLDSLYTSLQG